MNPSPSSLPTPDQVRLAIFEGRKIEAIKLHRELTGAGLKEAKEAVEKLEVELRQTEAHRFVKGAAKSGCFSVLLVGVALLVVTIAFLK
jgi:ribosomal protein L7/L12